MKGVFWGKARFGVLGAFLCTLLYGQAWVLGADAPSVEDMMKELQALRQEVQSLKSQMQQNTQTTQEVKTSNDQLKKDVEAVKATGPTAIKEQLGFVPNVYNELAKKIRMGMEIRTRGEYSNGFYTPPTHFGQTNRPFSSTATGNTPGGIFAFNPSERRDADYVLNRARFNVDADVHDNLRVFMQLQDSRVWGDETTTLGWGGPLADSGGTGVNRRVENNRVDVHQWYFDLRKLFGQNVTLRVGRQEIVWGDHRVIGNFVWSNIARSFDAVRGMWDSPNYAYEAWVANIDERGFFDIGSKSDNDERAIAQMFTFKKLIPNATLELMNINKLEERKISNTGGGLAETGESGSVKVYDFGFRLDGTVLGKRIDYTQELHGQLGTYMRDPHSAFATATRAGYTFTGLPWQPRIGGEFAWASGTSKPAGGGHHTFDNLYPTNHWQGNYGFIDLVSWRNIKNYRANILVKPMKKLKTQVDYHLFQLDQPADGWYHASGALIARPGATFLSAAGAETLAQEVDLTIWYDLYKNVGILAGYSKFLTGAFIDRVVAGTNPDTKAPNTDWGYLQLTVNF